MQELEKNLSGRHISYSDVLRRYPVPFLAVTGLIIGTILDKLLHLPVYGDYVWYATLIVGGIPIIISTVREMLSGKLVVDIIAFLAIITAVIMDEAFAGVVIVLMQSSGTAIENYGMRHATSELKKLLERRPKIAHLKNNDSMKDISVSNVRPGDFLIVKQGELIPVDGIVTFGVGEMDESSITGESRTITRHVGEKVLSGTVDTSSTIEMMAQKIEAESEYGKIVDMVRKAQKSKAPIQRIADRYGMWLVPITLLTALGGWLYTGSTVTILSVLVVATPCPLILATPIAIMGGLSRSTKKGIIVKGGGAIETLGRVQEVFFDKTGTLTSGKPVITGIVKTADIDEDKLLYFSGSAEQMSNHPIAKVIATKAREKLGELPLPTSFREIPGKGIIATVEGNEIVVGSFDLCNDNQSDPAIPIQSEDPQAMDAQGMRSCIKVNGVVAGIIVFSDGLREGVHEMVADLRQLGIRRTVMLTGDNIYNAQKVANQAGIGEFRAGLLPEEKLAFIRNEVQAGKTVAMVGDGINDAPALTAASVGIAMGVSGSDISAESSEVVLTVDDVTRVSDAISIGRRTLSIAMQSIILGMGLSAVFMFLAAIGLIYPAEGALIQEGIDSLAIMNSIRAVGGDRSFDILRMQRSRTGSAS
ncbi:MAG: heavy metal translocating P-type ATPase [Thermoplasmata archaeon]